MKTIKVVFALALAAILSTSCGGDKEEYTGKPVISDEGITANPIDCQQYKRGETITFQYKFHDAMELGSYNIEIHHNFDHHTHSTSITDCPFEANKTPVHPFVFNQNYDISAGKQDYVAKTEIKIPADVDPGDYHFMIRVTNKAGWQEIKGISIKITE